MLTLPETTINIVQIHSVFTEARIQHWLKYTLFTWQWWLLVALFIIPWIVWGILIDKKRFTAIILLGVFVLATVTWMDDLGSDLILWYYPYKLVPLYPQLIPINYAVLPISYMLIYQYFPPWRSYIIAVAIMAALFSFVAEPTLVYLGMYRVLKWQFYYSFPIYLLIGISHRLLVEKVLEINQKYSQQ